MQLEGLAPAESQKRNLVFQHRFHRKEPGRGGCGIEQLVGRIKFLIVAWGEWRTERKDVVFVFVAERLLDAVGVGISGLEERSGQQEESCFASHCPISVNRAALKAEKFALFCAIRFACARAYGSEEVLSIYAYGTSSQAVARQA